MADIYLTLTRIAILAFAGFTAWLFNDANFLLFILLLLFFRKPKEARKSMQQVVDDLHFKLEQIAAMISKPQTTDLTPLTDRLDKLIKFNEAQHLTKEERERLNS